MDIKSIEKYLQRRVDPDFTFADNRNERTPFTKLSKEISKTKVALISSAGLYLKDVQEPFDTECKFGDTSYRQIPKDVDIKDLDIGHTHYDHKYAKEDLNTVFPTKLLIEFEEKKLIRELAQINYSFSGYIIKTDEILSKLGPSIANDLKKANVDAAILSPV